MPKKFYDALDIIIYIASRKSINPISSKEISSLKSISPRHLESVLQSLNKNGVLKGSRGPKGGYILLKEKRKLTMLDIYNASCLDSKECLRKDLFSNIVEQIDESVKKSLSKITLADLCNDIKTDCDFKKVDFEI